MGNRWLWLPMALLAATLACGGPSEQAASPEKAAAPAAASAAPSEEGFVSIFDGQTLNGWKLMGGKGEGYKVVNGEIVLAKDGGGGNLLHEKEYTDFILRFEFKLQDGTNNGVAIRAPMADADMAYQAMEIQIIDNSSERYKDIQPWQKHGSLYNVFPATGDALKPVGEWNQEEIRVAGRQVTVVLNGQTILDVSLDDVKDPETLAKHPGLQNKSGHVGFLGHNEPIEIRNIRVKEL